MELSEYDELAFFRASEFGPHAKKMRFVFLKRLDNARKLAGVPFNISSAWRDDPDSTHGLGVGVDLKCKRSRERWKIVNALLSVGFTRIGVYDQHIHVDEGELVEPDKFPSHVIWWGKSQ